MSSFFTAPGAGRKRSAPAGPEKSKKRRITGSRTSGKAGKAPSKPAPAAKKKPAERDESISGSDTDDSRDDADDVPDHSGSDEDDSDLLGNEEETAAERRLRLAERYLDNVRQDVEVDPYAFDAEDVDRDLIAERLQEDAAELKGKAFRQVAGELATGRAAGCFWKWNSDTVTSVAASWPFAYTASKDSYLSKFRLQDLPQNQWRQTTRRKPRKPDAPPKRRPERVSFRRGNGKRARDRSFQGHTGAILAVAASPDGKYVATGGEDARLVLWDAETLTPIRTFFQHRDAVTGLAWRKGTNQLYSASKDRTVKVWSMDERAYVETLFGHQDSIVDIDALAQERCVSVGSRDRTARLWKVVEESQLIFRGGSSDKKTRTSKVDRKSLAQEGSIDRIAMIDDQLFVTGGDSGMISLWSVDRKKPVFMLQDAHGFDPPLDPTAASAEIEPDPAIVPPPQPRWITALRTLPYTDLILSGSWDGCVRVWRLSTDRKRIEPVGVLGKPTTGAEESSSSSALLTNGINGGKAEEEEEADEGDATGQKPIKGVINDIAVFERGEKGKDGLCIVCAVGKEHRLGRWKMGAPKARNGAVVFEVPRASKGAAANGVHGSSGEDGDAS
ncbi:WD domain, G-beta repeat-containing protein [Pleurostoma richardsiae]|uniref:WD domain, G-beta repeat-containing protein n=1 Tax=Pleurostoma richardsiae TaxID=41990 RepID=A0AA38S3S7_9PEZI|nr:WD domain, G-beta repeat-containing protein [Pleurostoma richardsiae]